MFKSIFKTFRYKKILSVFLLLSYVAGFVAISLAISQYYVAKEAYAANYIGNPEDIYYIEYDSSDFSKESDIINKLIEIIGMNEILYSPVNRSGSGIPQDIAIAFQAYKESPDYLPPLIIGRHFTPDETQGSKPIALAGKIIADRYDNLVFNGVTFEIIGIIGMEHRGSTWDDTVYLPFGFAETLFPVGEGNKFGTIRLHGSTRALNAALELQSTINGFPSYSNVYIYQPEDHGLDLFNFIVYTVIAILVLIITCVNVVNLSSFWIHKRKKEIGIRRALGATDGSIKKLVLFDMILLCFFGACLAITTQFIASLYIDTTLPIDITPSHLTMAILVPSICGIATTTIPMKIALKFEPKDAMKGR
ncbi:FtsX-like permease family protein [Alkalicella caledoniensis]|uniref:FtsX-like permease family protein n=1 Tax=Alkalicella caledoniensis TaxID=2731377 RepID=A0A7G9WA98_ALKCA|nr:FtsX-like permease family protein [Alkalicella caledoniensis]QNO15610.1 FtsX-like permease family protein [Alkalicella caledoniensis]